MKDDTVSKWQPKENSVAILMTSDKIDFKQKKKEREKDRDQHYRMIKGTIYKKT